MKPDMELYLSSGAICDSRDMVDSYVDDNVHPYYSETKPIKISINVIVW